MYEIGDRILYGIHGVCRVTGFEKQLVDKKLQTYLVLEPEGQLGARFLIPTHKEVAMSKLRSILSPEELEALLHSREVRHDSWIPDENQRKQYYRDLIGSGDRTALMRMVYSIYRHKASQAASGRKCHICDENFLRDAEKLLSGEIAFVLSLEPSKARDHLRQQLKIE